MKRVYKNWLVRVTVGFAALFSLRLISTAFHMSFFLEKIYKPRDFRKTSHLTIKPEILDQLPRYCTTVLGQRMDPINLLIVGTEAQIKKRFAAADWDGAHPTTPIHVFMGFLASLFKRSYRKGPLMPLFAGIGLQDLAFQKTTTRNKFAERHHIRLWRTRHELPGRRRLWVAAASHEVGMKLTFMPPFIVHRMNPSLDYERDYITTELLDQGCLLAGEYAIIKPISAKKPNRNPHGDRYYTDGRAKIIEIA